MNLIYLCGMIQFIFSFKTKGDSNGLYLGGDSHLRGIPY